MKSNGRNRPRKLIALALAVPATLYLLAHLPHPGSGLPGPLTVTSAGRPSNMPPPSREERGQPLGFPAPAPAGTGGYAFENTEPGTHAPVTWDPCRPIHYVVSGTAPSGQSGLIASVVAELTRVTGFRFVYDGPTSETPSVGRQPYQRGRYGARWAPVLVAWTDPATVPMLAGNVIGLGGGSDVSYGSARKTYVSGLVYLDQPQFESELRHAGAPSLRAVVLHEFGHLLGLAHVTDPSAVMFPEAQLQVTDYSSGDLRGLHALSTGQCASHL